MPGTEHRSQPQEQQKRSCLQKSHDLINVQLKKIVSQRNDLLHLGEMDMFVRPDRAGMSSGLSGWSTPGIFFSHLIEVSSIWILGYMIIVPKASPHQSLCSYTETFFPACSAFQKCWPAPTSLLCHLTTQPIHPPSSQTVTFGLQLPTFLSLASVYQYPLYFGDKRMTSFLTPWGGCKVTDGHIRVLEQGHSES